MTAQDLTRFLTPAPARRLLVITYHFPPDGAVGGLRWSGLSKYLARQGWEVHVLTAAAGDAVSDAQVHRHHVPRRRTLNDWYRWIRARSAASTAVAHAPGPNATSTTTIIRPEPAMRRLVTRMTSDLRLVGAMLLDFPDDGRGWVTAAAVAARRLHRSRHFDAVITSGPPHSAHFAGILATAGTRVPHVIDMRDPWRIMSRQWPGYALKSRLFGQLEKLMFRCTRHVVVNTREFADRLQRELPRVAVSLVTNGTDVDALPTRTAERLDGLSIAYAGTVYLGRSFATVLGALESLKRDRPADAARVKLRIAGRIGDAARAELEATVEQLGLAGLVELLGALPREGALDLLRRSHVALVLAQDQPTQVPAKLYECVGLGVPTLVVSETTSAASRESRRIGAMTVEPDDTAAMRRVLDELVDGHVPASVAPAAPIAYEALARQMDGLLRLVCAPAT